MVVCEECKKTISEIRDRVGPDERKTYDAVCSECGKNTTVPFIPRPGWSVYCKDCYSRRRRV